MGTPGSGRKRTPIKDRFSAEDEALSNIAREVCLENPLSTLSCTVGNVKVLGGGGIYRLSFTEQILECLLVNKMLNLTSKYCIRIEYSYLDICSSYRKINFSFYFLWITLRYL